MIVIDASVAVQWVADETGTEQALALLERDDLIAPELLAVEVGSALRRKLEQGEVLPEQVSVGLGILFGRVRLRGHDRELIERAIEFSLAMSHPVYDCVYVALAEIASASFATRDIDLAKKIRRSGYGHLLDVPQQ